MAADPSATIDSPATSEEPLPDLQVSLAFDKPSYNTRDDIKVRLAVVNAGSAEATVVRVVSWSGNLGYISWGAISGEGVRLEPGERVDSLGAATLQRLDADMLARMTVDVRANEQDANPADNTAEVTAPVSVVRGAFSGVVYADRNGNTAMDSGEQLSNIRIDTYGGIPFTTADQLTDVQGRFTFRDLPIGTYSVSLPIEAGWWRPPLEVTVDGVHDPDVVIQVSRKISELVTVTMAFTKDSYAIGEIARLSVRFTNTGSISVRGVTVRNWGTDTSAALDWGALAEVGPGVTIPAQSTVTFDVLVTIPTEAYTAGQLTVNCAFGPPPGFDNVIQARAVARVPGGIAPHVVGLLMRLRQSVGTMGMLPSDPLPGTKVYIRSQVSGEVVARAVTDARGIFVFANVPADRYDFKVVGPWKIVYGTEELPVRTGERDNDNGWAHPYFVMRGPEQPDPDAAPSPTPQPGVEPVETSHTTTDGLASTGANVIWLTIGGLLSLAMGVGLVLRRGRHSKA